MRSWFVAGCFFSYGLGSILIHFITLYILKADLLVLAACGLLCITATPSIFFFFETPHFLLNSGNFSELVVTLTKLAHYNGRKQVKAYDFIDGIITEEEFKLLEEAYGTGKKGWGVMLTKEEILSNGGLSKKAKQRSNLNKVLTTRK